MTEKKEQQQPQASAEETTGGIQSVVALTGTWDANFVNYTSPKSKFRSYNLGIAGKTVLWVDVEIGSTTDGPWFKMPIMTGFGNQSGNFVDIYYQWNAGKNNFSIDSTWVADINNIPYRIVVYYK